jgi:GTP1/Obg family GTP-binding protein
LGLPGQLARGLQHGDLLRIEAVAAAEVRARVQAARSLDTLLKGITTRLRRYCTAYPSFERLHPFEMSLLDLSVGRDNYWRILNNIDKLRKSINQVLHPKSLAS